MNLYPERVNGEDPVSSMNASPERVNSKDPVSSKHEGTQLYNINTVLLPCKAATDGEAN